MKVNRITVNSREFKFAPLHGTPVHRSTMFLSDEGPTLETLDFTIHIGSTLYISIWAIESLHGNGVFSLFLWIALCRRENISHGLKLDWMSIPLPCRQCGLDSSTNGRAADWYVFPKVQIPLVSTVFLLTLANNLRYIYWVLYQWISKLFICLTHWSEK